MPWWGIVLIVLAALTFVYFGIGMVVTCVFLRGKMRSEKEVRERERESDVPDEVFSYPCQETYLTNKRGLKMFARVYFAPVPTDKWVLLLHGFNSNGVAIMKYGKLFNELGYNALSPDFCYSGRSEGKFLSFGWYEKEDAAEWIDKMKKDYAPSQIGVFGVSMGAATAVHLTARRNDIDFLIPYCSYESYKRIVVSKGKDFFHCPFFGIFWIPVWLTTYFIAGKTDGRKLDVGRDLKKIVCPTLLLHSKKDNFTDYRNSVDLYEKNKENKNIRLHLFEKGLHARAFATDPTEYTRVIKEFLDDVNGADKNATA